MTENETVLWGYNQPNRTYRMGRSFCLVTLHSSIVGVAKKRSIIQQPESLTFKQRELLPWSES